MKRREFIAPSAVRWRRARCHPELDMAASDNSIGAVIGLLVRF
jgi:hypothetical protein